jgi:tRNA(Ile)-lysidine synthase
MRRRVLRKAVAVLRPSLTDVSFLTIDLAEQVGMEKETGAEATLPQEIKLRLEYADLFLTAAAEKIQTNRPQLPDDQPRILPVPGTVALAGKWRLSAVETTVDLAEVLHNPDPWVAYLDIGLRKELEVRPRMPGESMQPLGMGGRSATLQDIMVNRKLPAAWRDKWPVVATAEYALWLVGLHMDQRAKVSRHTRRIVRLHCYYDPS